MPTFLLAPIRLQRAVNGGRQPGFIVLASRSGPNASASLRCLSPLIRRPSFFARVFFCPQGSSFLATYCNNQGELINASQATVTIRPLTQGREGSRHGNQKCSYSFLSTVGSDAVVMALNHKSRCSLNVDRSNRTRASLSLFSSPSLPFSLFLLTAFIEAGAPLWGNSGNLHCVTQITSRSDTDQMPILPPLPSHPCMGSEMGKCPGSARSTAANEVRRFVLNNKPTCPARMRTSLLSVVGFPLAPPPSLPPWCRRTRFGHPP